MKKSLWAPHLIKSLKIAAAAFAAIAIAGELGLKYPATAGIITVLSIQNTKRDTLKSAGNRYLAFLCALILSGFCFTLIGYNLWAFGIYLFLFALFCLSFGWTEAIAMDSVLITHFLAEQNMGLKMLANEVLLLLVGIGMGILVNMHLHKKEAKFQKLADEVDGQIRGILQRMSIWLPEDNKSGYGADCFEKLEKAIHETEMCAISNYGNTVFSKSAYELNYINIRKKQSSILREIYDNIVRIQFLPVQAKQVAELLGQIGDNFYKKNSVEDLLEKQNKQIMQMKEQPLPLSREEFEARAILFYILMQIKQFLEI